MANRASSAKLAIYFEMISIKNTQYTNSYCNVIEGTIFTRFHGIVKYRSIIMNPTRLKFSGRRAFSMTLLISTLCLSALPKVQAKPPPIATKPFNAAANAPIRAQNYNFQRPAGKKTNAGSLRLTQPFNSSAGALPKTKIFQRPAGKSNIGRQSIQQPFNDAAKVPIKPRNYKFQQPAEQQKPIKSLTKVFERARTFSQ